MWSATWDERRLRRRMDGLPFRHHRVPRGHVARVQAAPATLGEQPGLPLRRTPARRRMGRTSPCRRRGWPRAGSARRPARCAGGHTRPGPRSARRSPGLRRRQARRAWWTGRRATGRRACRSAASPGPPRGRSRSARPRRARRWPRPPSPRCCCGSASYTGRRARTARGERRVTNRSSGRPPRPAGRRFSRRRRPVPRRRRRSPGPAAPGRPGPSGAPGRSAPAPRSPPRPRPGWRARRPTRTGRRRRRRPAVAGRSGSAAPAR